MTSATKKLVTTLFTLLCLCSASSATAAAQAIVAKIASPLSHTESGNYTLGLNFGDALMTLVMRSSAVIKTNTRLFNLNGYPEKSSFRSFQAAYTARTTAGSDWASTVIRCQVLFPHREVATNCLAQPAATSP